jgi:hypothetical protein
MHRKSIILVFVSALFVFLLVGCGSPPEEQINTAKAALQAAKDAEADRYVPDKYNAAKSALDGAMTEVKKQDSKLMFKNFSQAETMLGNATNLAKEAESAAINRKQEIQQQLPQMIDDLNASIMEVKRLMKRAPRTKESLMALQSIQADVQSLENVPQQANNAMKQGDYISAYNQVSNGQSKASGLIDELNQAISRGY